MPKHPPHLPDDEAPKVPIGDAGAGDDEQAPSGLPPGRDDETDDDPASQQDG